MMRSLTRLGIILVVVTWIFAVTFNYYIVHKPFSGENALALLNALGDVLVMLALYALAAAIGRRALRAFQFDSPLEALMFQTGVGLGLLALATFLLGLASVNSLVFWFLLLVAAFLLRADLRSVWRDMCALRVPIPTRFERALAVFIALVLAIGGLVALLPPIAWDAQMYHLVIPKIALEQGRITVPPDNVTLSYPSLVEMLFLAAFVLKGDIAAQLIHFGFLVLTLGTLFAMASRYFSARVGWLACAILVAVPSLVVVSTWAYVDVALAFYALVAFYALLLAGEKDDWRWYALAGVFAGLAMGVKYSGVIVPLATFFSVLLTLFARSGSLAMRWAKHLPFVIDHLSFVMLFAAPWYLRNFIFTGNPVYPFVFGGPYWDAFRANWFNRLGSGLINAPLQLLTVPWDATILGREGTTTYDATIGPLLLMLIPFLLLVRPAARIESSRRVLRVALIYSAILYGFWLLGIAQSKFLVQTRLLYPVFPILALVAACALEGADVLDVRRFSLQRFTRLVVLLVMGLTVLSYALGFVSDNPLAYLAGAESRDAYLARHLGDYYAAMKFTNSNLPKDARVFFLWEPRSYYADRFTQPDAILDAWMHLRWQSRDVDSIAAALQAHGYTHVLLSRTGLDFMLQTDDDPISIEEVRVLEEFATRHLQQVYGKTPLQVITRAGKPGVLDASADAYAIYAIVGLAK